MDMHFAMNARLRKLPIIMPKEKRVFQNDGIRKVGVINFIMIFASAVKNRGYGG